MTPPITELQKRKIKLMVDELIVNRGVLKIADRHTEIDGINIEQLSSLAFKYYKMIFMGESPLDIDVGARSDRTSIDLPAASKELQCCIGCGRQLGDEDIRIGMPVCSECREKVKVDYHILRDLFI